MKTETTKSSPEQIWDQLTPIFSNWRGVRPRKHWLNTGLSERVGAKRVRLLEGGESGRKYFDLTKNCSVEDLEYLYVRARVNFEQVTSAARLAIISNVTSVIGAFVLVNQIFPGKIAEQLETLASSEPTQIAITIAISMSLVFCISLIIILFVVGGVGQARDLKHLLELGLARRKVETEGNDKDGIRSAIEQPLADNLLN